MEPQAIPAELREKPVFENLTFLRFNGAAGDPCGVTEINRTEG